MKINSLEARELLEMERKKTKDDRWIDHSICVGNTAGTIAKALQLDEDFAKTLDIYMILVKVLSMSMMEYFLMQFMDINTLNH